MKSEIKSISSVRKEATVVIAKDIIQNEENSALQSFVRDVKIPGFRKGKVPLALIKSRYAKELQEQVDKTVASRVFDDIVKENNWEIFSLTKFDVKNTLDGEKELNFIVDLKPTFELFDYKNIEIEQPAIAINDEDITKAIEQIRNHYANYKEVKRPIQRGDFVRFQYEGTLDDGTKAIDLVPQTPIWAEQKNTWTEAGNENSHEINAITVGIEGMEIDGEKDIEMEFPTDFDVTELQGKKVIYHIKIFEIREKILPELDDAFFEKLKVKDLDELKTQATAELENRKLQILRFEQRESIVQKMLDTAFFEVPESAIQYEQIYIIRSLVEQKIHGGIAAEIFQDSKDKLVEDTQELSRDRAKVNFILEKIAEQEKITISEAEMNQMVIQEASMLGIAPNQLIEEIKNNQERIRELQRRAVFGKTLDFILLTNLRRSDSKEENVSSTTVNPAEDTSSDGSAVPINIE
ncbi:MAG: trigger factor [Puniceicoccales bacterium]|nr:trigger factor [Puniceicoccales bacterium]